MNMKDNKSIAEIIRNYRSKGMQLKAIAKKLSIPETSIRMYVKEDK